MRPGQRVRRSTVDAFDGDSSTGHVDSIAGSGAALQPAAAGERDRQLRQGRAAAAGEDRLRRTIRIRSTRLRPGMSVVPTVKVAMSDAADAPSAQHLAAPAVNPWLIAARRVAGDVHGGARHQHRQRRAAAHRGNLRRRPRREHLGPDVLPGLERHRPAAQRLARPTSSAASGSTWAAWSSFTVSSFLCGFAPEPGPPDLLPRAAGRGRRRAAAERAGDPRRHLSRRRSAAWPSPSTAWPWCSRRPSGRRSAAGSPTTIRWRWIFLINIPVGIVALCSLPHG